MMRRSIMSRMGAPRVPSARVIFQLTFCPIVTDVVGARATHRVFSRLVMHLQTHLRSRKIIRALAKASAAMVISAALLVPATAQSWNPFSFGGPPRQRAPQQQQQYNPFGNFFDPGLEQRRQRRGHRISRWPYSSAGCLAARLAVATTTAPISRIGGEDHVADSGAGRCDGRMARLWIGRRILREA